MIKKSAYRLIFSFLRIISRTLYCTSLDSYAWKLRRLHLPVTFDDLVLEVGSGGDPYPRSDVLLDAFEETQQRHWVKLVKDRPTFIAKTESMPFRDKAFDFVVASHVLEHSLDPSTFLNELQRVAKAGYIEVPDAFFERINPYKDHKLEITCRNKKLLINKKSSPIIDESLVELYEYSAKYVMVKKLYPRYPLQFHVRYYWNEKIDFIVTNDSLIIDPSNFPEKAFEGRIKQTLKLKLVELVKALLYKILRWFNKKHQLDIKSLIRCPTCHCTTFNVKNPELLECTTCGYTLTNSKSLFKPIDNP